MGTKGLHEWQQRLYANKIYVTEDKSGEAHNYYVSEEAAKLEVAFEAKYKRKLSVRPIYVHTLELSKERWGDSNE